MPVLFSALFLRSRYKNAEATRTKMTAESERMKANVSGDDDIAIYGPDESVLTRIVTATAEPVPRTSRALDDEVRPLSKASLIATSCLVMLCNLTQVCFLRNMIRKTMLTSNGKFISMFSTVAGGFEFTKRLGHSVGPGEANWMAASYS
ncbi:MAG: hypothetical protein EOO38_17175 [Cytophagaceae bacterium]|nr:MAG: hypothetical protein EOO38_17175 [Cytophagaceae bacterium]